MTALLLIGSPIAGRLADRIGPRLPMTLGPFVAGIGLWLAVLTAHTPSFWMSLFPAAVIFAVGLALTVAPLTTAVLSALGPRRAGIASAANSAISRFGGLVAVAILPALSLDGFTHGLEQRLAEARIDRGGPDRDPRRRERSKGRWNRRPSASMPSRTSSEMRSRGAFGDGFRWVMVVVRVLLFVGAAIAFFELSSDLERRTTPRRGGPATRRP